MKKTKTMDLKGNQYSQVKDRIKAFREDNPRGLIETTPSFQPDGSLLFKARILKDKADEFSGEAIAHSLSKTSDKEKYFEKQETIAVGRALVLIGYSADGEIASSEEMEEFEDYKETQRLEELQETFDRINATKTLSELAELWKDIGNIKANPEVIQVKNAKKEALSKPKQPAKNANNKSGEKQPRVAEAPKGESDGVKTQVGS
jgi:hypothetical protein